MTLGECNRPTIKGRQLDWSPLKVANKPDEFTNAGVWRERQPQKLDSNIHWQNVDQINTNWVPLRINGRPQNPFFINASEDPYQAQPYGMQAKLLSSVKNSVGAPALLAGVAASCIKNRETSGTTRRGDRHAELVRMLTPSASFKVSVTLGTSPQQHSL
ncbi:hypothetical protein GE21DRAFT_7156 [Neurospora crassa]|uniref:Uncharacterized protein n=1 Tax=Neurospora crassa (strain ATCC 24698 / 74-OR23-1A / CBS 708.71 / DSM 1257 / FGSC 987) TaxID=367110 RepID=Q7S249_NEUCR|nr:hypothetical protein NCU04560 [Neurospora crassa OR74A]EAA29423.3 hypothetical protein NCU04560 [Neurospora crassa OR74A]KHE83900.1 hypothetical protein GE21DRAFT_7156 [Neurospora crassa]|eukprot:XP_958659.3 hypothetical protein NCU04560 [Neurospora crassa OR74A]